MPPTIKDPVPSATAATDTASTKPESKTYTNWNAFNLAKLRPVMVVCQGYRPAMRQDFSCHTRLIPSGETLSKHIAHDHGGGFRLSLRRSDSKASPLWDDIADQGLEAHDFRCAACNAELRFHPTSLAPHSKPHSGMNRQSYAELARLAPGATLFINVLLKKGRPEAGLTDEDEFEDND